MCTNMINLPHGYIDWCLLLLKTLIVLIPGWKKQMFYQYQIEMKKGT